MQKFIVTSPDRILISIAAPIPFIPLHSSVSSILLSKRERTVVVVKTTIGENKCLTCWRGAYKSPLMLLNWPPSDTWPFTLNPKPAMTTRVKSWSNQRLYEKLIISFIKSTWWTTLCMRQRGINWNNCENLNHASSFTIRPRQDYEMSGCFSSTKVHSVLGLYLLRLILCRERGKAIWKRASYDY